MGLATLFVQSARAGLYRHPIPVVSEGGLRFAWCQMPALPGYESLGDQHDPVCKEKTAFKGLGVGSLPGKILVTNYNVWGGFSPHHQATFRHWLSVLQFNSILTSSTWR